MNIDPAAIERAFGRPVASYDVEPIDPELRIHSVTGGLFRVRADGETLVLKIVRRGVDADPDDLWVSGADPSHRNYWKREWLAFDSGLLDSLPGRLRAPRRVLTEELAEDECWIWMSDVSGRHGPTLTDDDYRVIGRDLGTTQGAYVAGRGAAERRVARPVMAARLGRRVRAVRRLAARRLAGRRTTRAAASAARSSARAVGRASAVCSTSSRARRRRSCTATSGRRTCSSTTTDAPSQSTGRRSASERSRKMSTRSRSTRCGCRCVRTSRSRSCEELVLPAYVDGLHEPVRGDRRASALVVRRRGGCALQLDGRRDRRRCAASRTSWPRRNAGSAARSQIVATVRGWSSAQSTLGESALGSTP